MKKSVLSILMLAMSFLMANAQSYEHFQESLKYAQEGYKESQFNVSLYYKKGWAGVTRDYQQAVYWCRKAADQGLAEAQYNLGVCYDNGEGVSQDYQQAVYWYRKAADQGLAEAQDNLGNHYYDGEGVSQDYQQAVYWYRKAADQGYAEAQCNLGVCYYKGYGASQDYQQAVYWLRKAADQGYAGAQCNLGVCYYKGYGVSQDYQQAVYWCRKAADQGLAEAQDNLGNHYYNGEGVSQDYQQAVYWYRKAADQGLAEAQHNLGSSYYNGEGVSQDYQQAVYWYRKAADQGYAEAQYTLGIWYYSIGLFSQDDRQQGVYWYRKAADQGYANAQVMLGDFYYNGDGVSQDYQQAVYWYRKAVGQGDAIAQYKLGNCYYFGKGVEENESEAKRWMTAAADQGYEEAVNWLEYRYLTEGNTKEAFDWFRKKAEEGDAGSQYMTARYYFEGNVVEKDYDEAKSWLDKAAQQGNESAKEMLEDKDNASIWKKVETERRRKEAKEEREYRAWKFGRYMSTFNCPKGATRPIGLSVGYVSKQWDYAFSDGTREKGCIFDEKPLNGVQAGLRWEPQLKFGFGFDTGIYYEYYQDKSPMYDDADEWGAYSYYMKMSEHNIHFPVHLEYRLNFAENFQVFFYGGVSLDYALYCKFDYYEDGSSEPFGTIEDDIYGSEDVLPDVKRFNAAWSFGGGIRVMGFQLNAGTRLGFINMSSSSDYSVKQNNPLQISLSYMF